jgi:hypothetical protein
VRRLHAGGVVGGHAATGKALRWPVILLDAEGIELVHSGWQALRVGAAGM